MHEGTSASVAISSPEIESQLERILASPVFSKAPRHSRFLNFVVRRTLAGATDCIKESLIGVEVFDRSPDYDPGAEPAVRVEAGRLRARLADYYKELGVHDPIHIDLPKGTYVPVFHRNGVEPTLEQSASETGSGDGGQGRQDEVVRPHYGRWYARPAAAIVVVAAIVTIGISTFLLIRMLTADNRPQSGRLEGSTFIVTNAKGQELWRKSFPEGFSRQYYEQAPSSLGSGKDRSAPPRMWFGDLEGNGHSDVLLLYDPSASAWPPTTTLICYSDRGKEKWRWTPGRTLPEIGGDPAIYRIDSFGVLNGARGKPSRIVVSSSHFLWHPQQIALLNANGKLISEYWHSGHLYNLTLADLDGDGREEIIATGISNGYRQATLVVLDPERVLGASTETVRPDLQIHGMGVAKERLRLLFPRSDLNKATLIYNEAEEASVLQDRIRVSVLECQQVPRCVILYDFDRDFHLLSAIADDQFRGPHEEYFRTNQPIHHFNAEEESEFQKVRCLVGCKTEFVFAQNR